MKSVPDFIEGYRSSNDILILGQCPSSNTKPNKNGTYSRLCKWLESVDVHAFAFHNVIPDKINSYDIKDVQYKKLYTVTHGRKKIIALGGFVERVCKKYNIPHYKIDHPSPRNRNLNDPKYEQQMLKRLRDYLND
jgi:hypothetical protein